MKRKTFNILFALVLVLSLSLVTAVPAAAATPTTSNYGDISLSGGFQSGHFLQVWDLTACDLVISFTYDANGLVDEFGGGAHAWAELGVREVGYGDFNPTWQVEGAGVWLATDYDWTANTFDPDPEGSPTLDLDDKLILQKAGGHGEGDYNLPSTPPNPGANHRVWWDRDGVDPWQNDETANTGGIYDIEIYLHATSATTGEAHMTINGLAQGFETDGNWNTIELTPAGMTFTGDMTAMQVFYGLSGYGATHSIAFNNITVDGCLAGLLEGMVTGGGWIDSPPGAYMPGPTNINGTFTGVPTSEDPSIACDPNNNPVTFSGWVDVTGITPNGAVVVGLVDQGLYDPDPSSWSDWFSGAYLYLGRKSDGTSIRVGPTDGFYYGEINQVGANVPYVDGGPNLINFSMTIYNGEITVTYGGNDYTDTYGEIEARDTSDAYPGGEFDSGAYVGLASWPLANSITYDIDIDGCTCGPTGKATFGFVAKYKKGATVPDGQTQFMFQTAGLNFHSSSYDWLVVAGETARFKGWGTVNGEEGYRFMLWAGDGDPDTFRIKIWTEAGGIETVVYDNGMNHPIGGGNIIVHKAKK